jgi:hypothetical protein
MPFAPNYQTCKRVEAYPIIVTGPTYVLVALADGTHERIDVPARFFLGEPAIPGMSMLVRYVDGYLSHCPTDVFLRDANPIQGDAEHPGPQQVHAPLRDRSPVIEAPMGTDSRLPGKRPHP